MFEQVWTKIFEVNGWESCVQSSECPGSVVRNKRSLLGGEQEIETESPKTREVAQWAVEQINRRSNAMFMHALLRVTRITRQVYTYVLLDRALMIG